MKLLKIFALLLISMPAFCQPTHGELLWKFADDHVGAKVGRGHCYELVSEGYSLFSGKKIDGYMTPDKYGVKITRDSVQAGDVIYFQYFDKTKNNEEMTGHVGVVYAVSETNMSVANQNYHVQRRSESLVEIVTIGDLLDMGPNIDVQVSYYRP